MADRLEQKIGGFGAGPGGASQRAVSAVIDEAKEALREAGYTWRS